MLHRLSDLLSDLFPSRRGAQAYVPEVSDRARDLSRKLWEGFGATTRPAITRALDGDDLEKPSKAFLAHNLSRWCAVHGDWSGAADFATAAMRFDRKFAKMERPAILRAEALSRSGNTVAAGKVIRALGKTNAALAASNLKYAERAESSDAARVNLLNDVYRRADLEELSMQSAEHGVRFDTIQCAASHAERQADTVSILMSVRNEAASLARAITLAQQQTWTALELIVVDDASDDETWATLQGLAAADARITALRNNERMGTFTSRNRALAVATGTFVTARNTSEWTHPRLIEVQVARLTGAQECAAVLAKAGRVTADMCFQIRPERDELEYLACCNDTLMLRRSDLIALGGWDTVEVGAPNELRRRIEADKGKAAIADDLADAPLVLRLCPPDFAAVSQASRRNDINFGVRRTYDIQHAHWLTGRIKKDKSPRIARSSKKTPFPIPELAAPACLRTGQKFDLVLVSDLSLMGGTRRCNEGYLAAATEEGLRVGVFQYPRWDLRLKGIASSYLDLCAQSNVELLTPCDEVVAAACIVHHPPILQHALDALPRIECEKLGLLVNQSPMQLWSEAPHFYTNASATEACLRYFNKPPEWIAISNRVQRTLADLGGYEPVRPEIWHPPYSGEIVEHPSAPRPRGEDAIRIGRHSRDHWTKWPATSEDVKLAYCAEDEGIECHLLGGIAAAQKLLEEKPGNWIAHEFDSVDVIDFIDALDVFVNFMHFDYIEEFGRNTMEAMARGKPVVLENGLKDIFGDSALYCDPGDVASVTRRLMNDPDLYMAQARKGVRFARDNCSIERTRKNLRSLLS